MSFTNPRSQKLHEHQIAVLRIERGFGEMCPVILEKRGLRIKKFCATTQFSADKLDASGFQRPFTLEEGLERTLRYEFIENHDDKPVFFTV